MVYGRHEDIAATTKRHPAIVRYRSGVSAAGKLIAQARNFSMKDLERALAASAASATSLNDPV